MSLGRHSPGPLVLGVSDGWMHTAETGSPETPQGGPPPDACCVPLLPAGPVQGLPNIPSRGVQAHPHRALVFSTTPFSDLKELFLQTHQISAPEEMLEVVQPNPPDRLTRTMNTRIDEVQGLGVRSAGVKPRQSPQAMQPGMSFIRLAPFPPL